MRGRWIDGRLGIALACGLAAPGCGKKDGAETAGATTPASPALSFSIGDASVEAVAFGDVALDTTKDVILTVKNGGGGVADGLGASLASGSFTFAGGKYPGLEGTCGASLAAGASCTTVLTYAPKGVPYVAKDDASKLKWSWDLPSGTTTTAILPLSGRGGRCVSTKTGVAQNTRAQWSTFEGSSNSDTTAQSFVSTFAGDSDGVTLALAKGPDVSQQAAAFEKITLRLTADCPNAISGLGYPCEDTLAEVDVAAADVADVSTTAAQAKSEKYRWANPVALEKGKTYWIVVSTVGHTAGHVMVARNTVAPNAYAPGLQIIGTYPDAYSRFDSWDLGFAVDACETFGAKP